MDVAAGLDPRVAAKIAPPALAPAIIDPKPEWRINFDHWMVNEGPKILFLLVWSGIQAILFFTTYVQYEFDPNYSNVRAVFGYGLAIARGCAAVLNFNCGIILFTVCRNIITLLRTTFLNRFVPFDKNITFHQAIAWTIMIFTIIHVGAHYFNFLGLQEAPQDEKSAAHLPITADAYTGAIATVAGSTGQLLVIVMLIMYTAAMEKMRRKYFEAFWYSHHLFIAFFILLIAHGAGCLIQPNVASAVPQKTVCIPSSWKWCILSIFVYMIERIWREVRSRRQTFVSKVIQHPSKVVEVQMKKPSMKYKSGQYLFLNCPEISRMEWHPFTISSAPEEDFISVHIRVVGDWTTGFATRLGCSFGKEQSQPPATLPAVHIDGPFGSASEDVFNFEVAVLIGAGIGVTPFSSVLKSIWYRVINPSSVMKLRKVYFFWVCRDTEAFEWFQDLLEALEAEDIDNFLEIHIYLTAALKADQMRNVIVNDNNGQDALTGLRAPTRYGRPNFDQIFAQMAADHVSTNIGVFFCGPKVMSTALHKSCNKSTSTRRNGTKFFYHKENF